jgi:cysteine desulfurase
LSVYLDYNATAKVRPEAAAAMARALEVGGNPSSVHASGRAARAIVEDARGDVARLVGAKPESVVFVSGGTEANALAIASAVEAGVERVIVGATEHDAVLENVRAAGLPLEMMPVDREGVTDLNWLRNQLRRAPRALVCLMLANNETGVVQPIAGAADLVREAGGLLHVDAVQAAGKIAVDFGALGADTLALSAHKLGGPPGVGALIGGPRATMSRQMHGGGQERGRRSGTENWPGIAGFGAAAITALEGFPAIATQAAWRDELAAMLKPLGVEVLGEGAPRLSQTLCFAAPGFASELQVMGLDLAGVMVSAGAACSSGKVKPSRVIEAMGRPELAPCAIRVSGGWASSAADWACCGLAWTEIFARHQARRRALADA